VDDDIEEVSESSDVEDETFSVQHRHGKDSTQQKTMMMKKKRVLLVVMMKKKRIVRKKFIPIPPSKSQLGHPPRNVLTTRLVG
jgi:hypothetical protein